MADAFLEFDDVCFYYESSNAPVFDGLTLRLYPGWTGIVGANGSGKTTLLRLAARELRPQRGSVRPHGSVAYCPQRTDDLPADMQSFIEAVDHDACRLRGVLGIGADWFDRWTTLSHGERKRAQIGVTLWRAPLALALDEPTNHIDRNARRLLAQALSSFAGVGLLVSHDRELLDALCGQCLMIDPPAVTLRPGGYTKAAELAAADEARAREEYRAAAHELKRLRKTAADRAREAARTDRIRSKRGIAPKDHDAKSRIDLARYSGKDGQAGRVLRQLDGRLAQAEGKLKSIRAKKQARLGILLPGETARRDVLVSVPAGKLPLGAAREVAFPELAISPEDRVALVGPNGAGKTTLVRHVMGRLRLPPQSVVYLAQEIPRETARQVVLEVRKLPRKQLGKVISYFARLGSSAERVLGTDDPSPGELREIMLALGVCRNPQLIIMDEPTNHLDLPSIECLEAALAECPSALLLVSHDFRFLRRLTKTQWEIRPDDDAAGCPRMRLFVGQMSEETLLE